MRNPWLDIPLADYEAHMALPSIGQARLLADAIEALVARYAPRSVAVLGCAGGNGFNELASAGVDRVVGVDVNAQYLEIAHRRYGAHIRRLELYTADIEQAGQLFEPVDFIYAALVLEYVDEAKALDFVGRHCVPNGTYAAIVQQPHACLERVSPSPYVSLHALEASSRWVFPEQLREDARRASFRSEATSSIEAPDGKRFAIEVFKRAAIDGERETQHLSTAGSADSK